MDAKKDLHQKYLFKRGIKLSNLSVASKHSYFVFYFRTLVTLSAEVYDCIAHPQDSSNISTDYEKINLSIYGVKVDDSLVYMHNEYAEGITYSQGKLKKHLKNKVVTDNYYALKKLENKKVSYKALLKVTRDDNNLAYFGFEFGDTCTFNVYSSAIGETKTRKCPVVGLRPSLVYISYIKDNGDLKKLPWTKPN